MRKWSHEEATEVFPRSHRARRAASEYSSQWAAIESIAAKIGCTPETLRRWVRQQERDTGQRPGPTTAEEERIKALEREVRELRKANEILRLASAFFAQAELDRRFKS
ncbi:transposase [Massilia kyonggiensis]